MQPWSDRCRKASETGYRWSIVRRLVPHKPHKPAFQRGQNIVKFMAPLENQSMFRNKSERPLLQMKLGAFLYSHLRILGRATEGCEDSNFRIKPNSIIAPVPGRDHASVKIKDALKLRPVESSNRTPIPRMRKRRDDTQALFTLGWG